MHTPTFILSYFDVCNLSSSRVLGPFHLGLHTNRPKVTANLHPEKDLVKELQPGKPVSKGMPMLNAENVEAKFENPTKQLKINMSSVQISQLKRTAESRSREERVTECKYGMIFSVKMLVNGKEHLVKVGYTTYSA